MENKITEKELKTIQDQQQQLNALLRDVGILESQKHGILHEIVSVNKEVEDYKQVLEKEYGQVNINLQDGSYVEIEQDVEDKKN